MEKHIRFILLAEHAPPEATRLIIFERDENGLKTVYDIMEADDLKGLVSFALRQHGSTMSVDRVGIEQADGNITDITFMLEYSTKQAQQRNVEKELQKQLDDARYRKVRQELADSICELIRKEHPSWEVMQPNIDHITVRVNQVGEPPRYYKVVVSDYRP